MSTTPRKWKRANAASLAGLCLGFGILFYLAYYVWWPFIFLATTPLALVSEHRRVGWTICLASVVSAATLTVVYRFFAVYSLGGLLLISCYHGLTMGCVVAATHAVRRWTRLPLAFVFPPLWTGGEYWRMMGDIGLPLGLLAPPVHDQLWMIQICDMGGLHLLSFSIAIVGAAMADFIRDHFGFAHEPKNAPINHQGYITALCIWAGIAAYGRFRIHQASNTMSKGPVLTVIQPDIPTRPQTGFGFDPNLMLRDMMMLGDQAMQETTKPDLVVWPEVPPGMPIIRSDLLEPAPQRRNPQEFGIPFGIYGKPEPGIDFYQTISDWVGHINRPLIMGAFVEERQNLMNGPRGRLRNAGICLEPSPRFPCQRQYKMRLFPIGEYLPWKDSPLYPWFMAIAPKMQKASADLEIYPGTHREILTLPSSSRNLDATTWRYVVSICNEIMFPEDAGIFLTSRAHKKPVDFVVNISNNGGFQRNHASLFHSLLLPFRAVEARIGIARSSNTGISGFVKPTGEVYGEVVNDRGQRWTGMGAPELDLISQIVEIRRKHEDQLSTHLPLRNQIEGMMQKVNKLRSTAGISGQSTRHVWVDQRKTIYSQTNDWFAKTLCLLLWIGCAVFMVQIITTKRC